MHRSQDRLRAWLSGEERCSNSARRKPGRKLSPESWFQEFAFSHKRIRDLRCRAFVVGSCNGDLNLLSNRLPCPHKLAGFNVLITDLFLSCYALG